MNIALLGYGTVGRSLDELLGERPVGIVVSRILRRSGKTQGDPRMTDDIASILSDESIEVVAEAMSGEEPAAAYIESALLAGKHVVTANKAAIAPRLPKLLSIARERGVVLAFEASAGGVIPWIANLRRAARFDRIDRFCGILNGTGNYLIDRMTCGLSFGEALAEAQALGFAEADPTADVGGFDLVNKSIVTAAAAFGCVPGVETPVPVVSLEKLSVDFMHLAAREGKTVRFMAFGRCAANRPNAQAPALALGVAPVLLSSTSLEAGVGRNYNLASFYGDVAGPMSFFGQGAGGRPTADAMIADMLDIARGAAPTTPPVTAAPDDSLLFGTGLFEDGTRIAGTFVEIAAAARREGERRGFLAFEPDASLFSR